MPRQTIKTKEHKAQLIGKYKTSNQDTGSSEVQTALLTDRIHELTAHLKTHPKDFSSQRGLLKFVGQRRRILDYIKSNHMDRYVKLINQLELRK